MRLVLVWSFVVLAGCGSEQSRDSDLDGVVAINAVRPHAMVGFRHEDEATWELFQLGGSDEFKVTARGPYRVLFVCEDRLVNRALIVQLARTPEDAGAIENTCPVAAVHRVTGTVSETDTWVGFGDRTVLSFSADWRFEIRAAPGVHDLAIMRGDAFETRAIAIRRDIAVSGDLELGAIDVAAANPVPLISRSLTVENVAPSTSFSASTELVLGGTTLRIFGSRFALLAPAAVLRPTDIQRITVAASAPAKESQSASRIATRVVGADTSAYVLPEPIRDVTFATSPIAMLATWSSLPPYTHLVLSRTTSGLREQLSHSLDASPSFIESTGSTSLALDLGDVPGFKPEWQYPASVEQVQTLSAVSGDANVSFESEVSQTQPPISSPLGASQGGGR